MTIKSDHQKYIYTVQIETQTINTNITIEYLIISAIK